MRIIGYNQQSTQTRSDAGFKHAPSFGYNKVLNKELEEKTARDHSPISNAIKSLNYVCNETEDSIRTLIRDKGLTDSINLLTDTFLVTKVQLCELVEEYFPNMHFKQREAKSYKDEIKRQPMDLNSVGLEEDWRETVSSEMTAAPMTMDEINKLTGKAAEKPDVSEVLEEINDTLNGIWNTLYTENATQSNESKTKETPATPEVIEEFKPGTDSPKGFSSLGGMEKLKTELQDKIIDPIKNPEQAELDKIEYGKKYPKGIMFYGPPGCGKTFITEAVAAESGLTMFKLKVGKAGSIFINGTSQNYEKAFNEAEERAKKDEKPVLMFIDEIDGVSKGRESGDSTEDLKQIGTLLDLISGARNRGIIVISATNKYDLVDDAVKRRFDSQIFVDFPDEDARGAVLKKTLEPRSKAQALLNDENAIKQIAQKTNGFSNDDLCVIADYACNLARLDNRANVNLSHFLKSIEANQGRKIKQSKYVPKNLQKPIGYTQKADVSVAAESKQR